MAGQQRQRVGPGDCWPGQESTETSPHREAQHDVALGAAPAPSGASCASGVGQSADLGCTASRYCFGLLLCVLRAQQVCLDDR